MRLRPAGDEQTAALHRFVWNFPRGVWEPAAITNALSERDTCSLGLVQRSNVGPDSVLRLRVISSRRPRLAARVVPAFITRGRRTRPAVRRALTRIPRASKREVLVHGRVAARRACDALSFCAQFAERDGSLLPRIICQEIKARPTAEHAR